MTHKQLMREFDNQSSQFVNSVKSASAPAAIERLREFLKARKKESK